MGRYKSEIGGYFRMWSRLWLNDEKIRDLKRDKKHDLIVDLIDYFCFANECLSDGRFESHGVAFARQAVEQKLGIDPANTDELIRLEFLQTTPFSVKNWEKYQNPNSKRDFIPDLKQDLIESEKAGGSRKPKSVSRKPLAVRQDLKEKPLSPGTPQAIFLDWYKVQYLNRFKKPYKDSQADYVNAAAGIKAFGGDIELLKRHVLKGWDTPDKKDFSMSQACMTVKGFFAVVNHITVEPPKKKTMYEMEQERKNA